MQQEDLKKLLKKPGYGLSGGIKGSIGKSTLGDKDSRSGKVGDLEPTAKLESLRAEKLQVNYAGKVRVRLKFFRRRLADYSRAISEKALVDCLQYGGLIIGDSETEIWLIDEGQHKVETTAEERTEIVLEYEAVDLDDLWVKAAKNDLR